MQKYVGVAHDIRKPSLGICVCERMSGKAVAEHLSQEDARILVDAANEHGLTTAKQILADEQAQRRNRGKAWATVIS